MKIYLILFCMFLLTGCASLTPAPDGGTWFKTQSSLNCGPTTVAVISNHKFGTNYIGKDIQRLTSIQHDWWGDQEVKFALEQIGLRNVTMHYGRIPTNLNKNIMIKLWYPLFGEIHYQYVFQENFVADSLNGIHRRDLTDYYGTYYTWSN